MAPLTSEAHAPLTTVELISKAAGFQGLGFAAFSHAPQIILNFVDKPRVAGPSFGFMLWWLAGDMLSVAGLVISGGLVTHIIQTAWYLAGDLAIMWQLLWYRGYIPGTQRRKDRKLAQHTTARMIAVPGMMASAYGMTGNMRKPIPLNKPRIRLDPPSPTSAGHSVAPSLGKPRGKRQSHSGYTELSMGKSAKKGDRPKKPHPGDEAHADMEKTLDFDHMDAESHGFVHRLFTTHKNITQPVLLVLLISIMGVVWFFTTYQKRETEGPLHHPSPPESSDHWSIIAFLLGWAGTACYNVPRALLLYETVWVLKSCEGFEVWMFIALMLENVATGTSIWIVSRDNDYLIAQSPYITGIFLALSFDLFYSWLTWHYRKNPFPDLPPKKRPWESLPYLQNHTHHQIFDLSLELDAERRNKLVQLYRHHTLATATLEHEIKEGLLTNKDDIAARRNKLDKDYARINEAHRNLSRSIQASGDASRIAADNKDKQKPRTKRRADEDWKDFQSHQFPRPVLDGINERARRGI